MHVPSLIVVVSTHLLSSSTVKGRIRNDILVGREMKGHLLTESETPTHTVPVLSVTNINMGPIRSSRMRKVTYVHKAEEVSIVTQSVAWVLETPSTRTASFSHPKVQSKTLSKKKKIARLWWYSL